MAGHISGASPSLYQTYKQKYVSNQPSPSSSPDNNRSRTVSFIGGNSFESLNIDGVVRGERRKERIKSSPYWKDISKYNPVTHYGNFGNLTFDSTYRLKYRNEMSSAGVKLRRSSVADSKRPSTADLTHRTSRRTLPGETYLRLRSPTKEKENRPLQSKHSIVHLNHSDLKVPESSVVSMFGPDDEIGIKSPSPVETYRQSAGISNFIHQK